MADHTPGPWPITESGDYKRIGIGMGLMDGYEIAEVYSDDCDYEVAMANARLISAAPDLLAALKRLILYGDIFRYQEWESNPFLQAKAAIALAEGSHD